MMNIALIVDDSALARLTLKRYLEKYDMDVFEAECVADCRYWLLHNQMPDVVFMDIAMPGEDGFEGLAEIRAGVETKHLPVIMYSGDASEEAKQRAREGGATGFLRKPVNEAHLKSLLDRMANKLHGSSAGMPLAAQVVAHSEAESAPSIAKQDLLEIRNGIGKVNIALERQQDEISMAKNMVQRQANDITHLQNNIAEQDQRTKMIAIMGIVATVVALIALFVAIFS